MVDDDILVENEKNILFPVVEHSIEQLLMKVRREPVLVGKL